MYHYRRLLQDVYKSRVSLAAVTRLNMSTIKERKTALRQEVYERLGKITPEERKQQTAKVLEKLFNLPAFQNSQRISVFLGTETEIDTEPIIRKIFETNRKCYVPRYNGTEMEMVRLKSMEDWDALPVTKWNIKQPRIKEEREDAQKTGGLDLVVLPGVGFTKNGKRCGHGKGYYDSFMTKLFKSQPHRPTTVALCFKEQVMDDIPTHEHDVILDYILYDDGQ